jgi:hypothetical protein
MDRCRDTNLDADLAIARAAIRQARKETMKRLFAVAMVENDAQRRTAILEKLGRFIEQGRERHGAEY